MITIVEIFKACYQTLTYLTLKDYVEISFLSCAVYFFMRWLNKDHQKNLLPYFYGYCLITFTAHYSGLLVISQCMIIAAPLMVCVFIILHQHTLQKNFVALKTINPATKVSSDWIEELIRSCLYAMNKSKSLVVAVERNQSLATALQAPCLFYADLKKDLLDLLLENQEEQETVIWVNKDGKLVATNVSWHIKPEQGLMAEDQTLPIWQQYALLITAKTDALILYSCALTRTFSMIAQEKIIEGLSAHQATTILRKLLLHNISFHEGIHYAAQTPKSAPLQRQP